MEPSVNSTEDLSLVLGDFRGFLGDRSTRFLPGTQARHYGITIAGSEALVPKEDGARPVGTSIGDSSFARGNAAQVTYSISSIRFTIKTCSLNPGIRHEN